MKYILAALVLTFSMQSSADSWLCITDHAAGMNLKNGGWESERITPGDKYLIKEAESYLKSDGYVYQVQSFGDDLALWVCGDFGSDEYSEGNLVCDGLIPGGTFKVNPSNGHFLATRTYGYVTDDDDGSVSTDTPMVQIGKCAKI
ncbi:hypothetical protein [Candidatus Marimicrobium litorale]|uniref:Uncharacterized protein n=1 Tax=Candidatus Marimicrobium litorale TaxID=2518991 RepID=A0ABT3T289_9GAMM|nr:hypothetical protein [Candidatus Marimicrobium litorale]MCX2976375.1 hypothetical protein [Candidatus Marimicrobium litorale]